MKIQIILGRNPTINASNKPAKIDLQAFSDKAAEKKISKGATGGTWGKYEYSN